MATDTRSRRTADARSGGKTTKSRRVVVPRTPYERHKPVSRTDESQSPGWLSGLIFPATRKIASGAGKILSTVFGSDSFSSSDASSFESFSGSDDYTEYAKDETACSLEGAPCWNEVDGKSETKIEIEQLIQKETFSRKECDRLIEIMKSRVVNNSSAEKDREMLDMRNRAILEAKRWIEERRFGSPSTSKVNQVTSTCNSKSPQALELQIDSPADLAKSYIMARPPWSSPFSNLNSSLSEIGNSSKAMPHSHMTLRSGSLSNTRRKTDFLSSGSWNIVEEMRKVRSEATEDILKSFPSVTANLQICMSEKNENKYHSASDFGGKKSHSLDTSKLNTIDTSQNLAVVIDEGTQVENGLLNIPTVSYSSNHQVMDFGHHADRTTKQQTSGTQNATEGIFDHFPASSMGRREVECNLDQVTNVTVNREASLDMLMDGHEEDDSDIAGREEWSPSEEDRQKKQQQQQRGTKHGRCGKRGRGKANNTNQ